MTDNSSDSRKPTLRAGARRDNFGATFRKPARGNAPLARFVKREPSAYEIEVRKAASAALQKLEHAASRPEQEPQAPRYGRERNDDNRGRYEPSQERRSPWEERDSRAPRSDQGRDYPPRRDPGFEPRNDQGREYTPRRDQRFEPRNDQGRDPSRQDSPAAPRAQPAGDSPLARALSVLGSAVSTYQPSQDPTRQRGYDRSGGRSGGGYEQREYRDGIDRGGYRERDQAPRFDDRRSERRDERGDDRRYETRGEPWGDQRRDSRSDSRGDHRGDFRVDARADARSDPRDFSRPPQRDAYDRRDDRQRDSFRGDDRDNRGGRDNLPVRRGRDDVPTPHKPAHMGPKTEAEKAGGVRLNKRLAELGMCSRREGDAWIEKGWVLVNGEVALMGQTVFEADNIEVAEAAQAEQAQQVTILLHKPMAYVSGLPEDGHESAATLIGPQSQWVQDPVRTRFQARFTRGLAPAGRLDIDSTGLIVFTQNGLVARQLIGENSNIEKEYLVRVQWVGDNPSADSEVVDTDVESVFPPERLNLLREGLFLDDQALLPAQVSWQNPEQLNFVLKEGKKRQIRRMCEQVGLKVVGLKRIRVGTVVLGNLPVGQWRFLAPNERFGD